MKYRILLLSLLLTFSANFICVADDKPTDHRFVAPISDSEIYHQEISELDEYKLGLSTADDEKITVQKLLIGKITKTTYQASKTVSTFAIFNHMRKSLVEKGFEIIFECKKDETGNRFNRKLYELNPYRENYGYKNSIPLTEGKDGFQYYLVVSGQKPVGKVYISVFVTAGWDSSSYYRVDVIECTSENESEVKPENLLSELSKKGKILNYSVKFAPKQAELSADAIKALEPVAEMLKSKPELKLLVVSHCAEQDSNEANTSLSEQRAQNVANALVNKYQIAAERLSAKGLGVLCPIVGSNESTKAQNTRIEFVENWTKSIPVKGPALPANKPQSRSMTTNLPDNVPAFDIKHDAALAVQAQKEGKPIDIGPQTLPIVEENAPVNSVVAPKPEPLVSVPSVTGKMRLMAKNTLSKMGFKVKLIGKKVGKVSKQSPAANSKVKFGSTVTLTIGK